MNDKITLHLSGLGYFKANVEVNKTDSIRSLIEKANISLPNNSYPLFIYKSRLLQIDLSFLYNNVEDGGELTFIFKKNPHIRRINLNKMRHNTIMQLQDPFFNEKLKVYDLRFKALETSKKLNKYDKIFSKEEHFQGDYFGINNLNFPTTISDNSQEISSKPLPVCWMETEEMFSLSSPLRNSY